MKIVVGSESRFKIDAVREAAASLGLAGAEIVGCKTDSGVPEQPYGRLQTLAGAKERARQALEKFPGAYAVGIENGLVPHGNWTGDLAYVAVITPDGRHYTRQSIAVAVPDDLVQASLASGQTVTAGKLEAKRSGCDHADPHVVWSKGQANRKDILFNAVVEVLTAATRNEKE